MKTLFAFGDGKSLSGQKIPVPDQRKFHGRGRISRTGIRRNNTMMWFGRMLTVLVCAGLTAELPVRADQTPAIIALDELIAEPEFWEWTVRDLAEPLGSGRFTWVSARQDALRAGPESPVRFAGLPMEETILRYDMDIKGYRAAREPTRLAMTRYQNAIQEKIDAGYPVLWSVMLGLVPETPALPQARGGHLRLIIGYNLQTKEVLYSDTWGTGHELKRMAFDDAHAITLSLFTMEPR